MRDAHLSGLTTNQTSTYDKPTVRQLKIAFQETPLKLREIEDGWRGKRQQQLEEAKCTRGSSRQPSKSSTTRSKGGVRNVEAAVDRQSYLPSPPPSPSEPRRQSSQAPHPPPSTLEPSIFNTSQPRPILAFPLTPTVWPRNVAVGVSLHVPETASTPRCELHLNLGHQRVVVGSGGRCLIWTSEMNTRQSSKRIELDNAEKWSDVTRKRWELVHDLVEQVKRKTPRIKIFHPLGTITSTCSSIPDIQLAFEIHTSPRPPAGAPQGRLQNTRVRLVYSPSTSSIRVYSSLFRHQELRASFRTRRIVTFSPEARSISGRFSLSSTAQTACHMLGFVITDDWLDSEITAVERFWKTRDEWIKYVARPERKCSTPNA